MRPILLPAVLGLSVLTLPVAAAEIPDAIAAPGEILVATAHAVGAQVYACEFDTAGNLVWQFREPIATLFVNGRTVGRHYAGPSWELTDGSVISAKVAGRAPAASESDIPLLKLDVTVWRGEGQLTAVTTIQRINTNGGVVHGGCDVHGKLSSVPYTADYAFYRKGG